MKSLPALTVPVLLLALAGCAAPAASSDEGVSVVASTDVWASIAQSIGGDRVSVTAVIDSPDKDPHEYEATARDQLAVSRADLVIENGGGYDPFVDVLLEASGAEAAVVNAVELSGSAPAEGEDAEHSHEHIEGFNEHVWYDLETAGAVAREVAEELARLDPAGAETYEAGLESFRTELEKVAGKLESLKARTGGKTVVVTETVPLALLVAAGFTDVTPPAFAQAVEEGSDVAPAALQEVLVGLADGDVALLAYNEQAETGQTERVRQAAEAAQVPVVPFTETLPERTDYAAWMEANVARLAAAVPE